MHFQVQAQQESEIRRDTILSDLTRLDSVKLAGETRIDSLQDLADKVANKLDSLSPEYKLQKMNSKLDSVRGKLTHRIDSIKSLNPNDVKLVQSLDSLRSRLDSLKTLGPIKDLKKAEAKLSSLQSDVTSKVNKVEKDVAAPLKKFADNGANVPGEINIPGMDNLSVNDKIKLPSGDLPSTDIDGLGGKSLGSLDKGLPNLNTDQISLNGIDANELGGIGSNLSELGEVGGKIGEASSLADTDKLAGKVESEVKNMDQLEGLDAAEIDYEAMKKKWSSDPDVAREMALGKAKEEAVNHFAGHEEELKTVMEQLAKIKSKQPDAEGVVDLFAKRKHSLKNKSFVERLVPGLTLQLTAGTITWFDFNPFIGYQLSGRLIGGLGWNERLSVNFKQWHTIPRDRIYGPRTFMEFKWKEHISVKAESEWMNTYPKDPISLGEQHKDWVWTFFAGIKNNFNLSDEAKGHVQILYNVFDRHNRSPYVNKINVRFGLEIPLSRKAKPYNQVQ